MIRYALTLTGILILLSTGCFIFNPSEVSLSASPVPVVVTSPEPSESQTAYGPSLTRVIRQQDKVIEALEERDWSDMIDESGDWTEYVRLLSGYADTTHDRVLFRQYCDELLIGIRQVRDSAIRRDASGCHSAIRACDPVLDKLSREFPVTRSAAAARRYERNRSSQSDLPRMP